MTLLIGSDRGLYRVESVPFDDDTLEQVLDCGMVFAIRTFEHTEGVFLASAEGAYRSTDGGTTWENLEVPLGERFWYGGESEVWSILATADGSLYAGTNDPYLYRSVDEGETWNELLGFRDLPSRGIWESPVDPHYARLRGLEAVPGRPEVLIAVVEAGGIHVSYDAGRTWNDHRDAIIDDVHQVVPLTEDVWLAPTGYLDLELEHVGLGHAVGEGGLYRTTDGGESWDRIDTDNPYSYIRKVFVHDGTVFFGGAEGAPPAWAADVHDAALFESTNFMRTYERVEYPSEPHQVIEAWTVLDGDVICGSGLFDIPDERSQEIEGHVMRREEGTYETVGTIPANVGRLQAI